MRIGTTGPETSPTTTRRCRETETEGERENEKEERKKCVGTNCA